MKQTIIFTLTIEGPEDSMPDQQELFNRVRDHLMTNRCGGALQHAHEMMKHHKVDITPASVMPFTCEDPGYKVTSIGIYHRLGDLLASIKEGVINTLYA